MNAARVTLFASALGLSLLSSVALPGAAFAVDEQNVTRGATIAGPGLAAHGYDVVSFFSGQPGLGDDKYEIAYNGATYRFASQANLDTFKAASAKYEPAYGGYCAYGAWEGKKFDGDPRFWKIVDGRLYFNLNGEVQTLWLKDIPGHIKAADVNWTKIRSVAVEKL